MDSDLLEYLKPLLGNSPGLAQVIGWLIVVQTCRKWTSEILFLVAKVCGRVDRKWAKWVGKSAWKSAQFVSGAWSLPKQYIRAKYVDRPRNKQ